MDVKRFVRPIVIGIVIALIVGLVGYFLIPLIAHGKFPLNILPIIGFIIIIPGSIFAFIVIYGSFATGVDYLMKPIRAISNRHQKKVQEEIKEFENNYSQYIKRTLGTLPIRFSDSTNSPVQCINIENDAFTMFLGPENTYDEPINLFSEPEKLIHTDQANLQYRIMSNPPVLDLINEKHYVLVAPIGSGKTLYLRKLALLAVSKNSRNVVNISLPTNIMLSPVYIDLLEFSDFIIKRGGRISKLSNTVDGEKMKTVLFKYIAKKWEKNFHFVKTILDKAHEFQGVLLLFDGLDELSVNKRNHMLKVIESLAEGFSTKSTYFVVARREHQITDLPGFKYPRLEDFCLNDIYQFTTNSNIIPNISTEKKKALTYEIENHPRLQALAAIPLALIHMAFMQSNSKNIEKSYLFLHRAELYKRVTDDLLARWNKSFIDTEARNSANSNLLSFQNRRQLLEYLAWDMHKNKTYRYSEEQIKNAIQAGVKRIRILNNVQNEDLQSVKGLTDAIYKELIPTNGLITAEIGNPENYRFLCIPLQEYLASQFLINRYPDIIHALDTLDILDILDIEKTKQNYIENRYNDPWWEEVLMLYLIHVVKNSDTMIDANTLTKWLEPTENDAFCTKATFAGQVLTMYQDNGERLISNEQIKQIGDKLCGLLKISPFLHVRKQICHILMDLGIEELSNDDMSRLAKTASWNVTIPNGKKLHPLLLSNFEKSSPEVQKNLYDLQTMNRGGIKEVMETLKVKPGNSEIGADLIQALCLLDKRDLTPDLLGFLMDKDITFSIKANIVQVLGTIGDWNTVEALIELLSKPELESQIKWLTVSSLAMLGSRLGYKGEKVDKKEICLFNKLKELSEKSSHYDDYIRWNIAISLCTTFFAKPNGRDHKRNEFSLDYRTFHDNIAEAGVSILLTKEDKEKTRKISELIDKAKFTPAWSKVWLYLCDSVGQLANTTESLAKLKDVVENLCKLSPQCNSANICNKLSFDSCHNTDLREYLSYTEYIVGRRIRANTFVPNSLTNALRE